MPQFIIASDYRGVELREELSQYAEAHGWVYKDIGIPKGSPLDYVDISRQLAAEITGIDTVGILICGSGEGVAMATNRYAHIRAAVCRSVADAESVRSRLNANVVCLGSRHVNLAQAVEIIQAFVATPFGEAKHGPYAAKLNTSATQHTFNGVNLLVRAVITHADHVLLTRATSANREFPSDLFFLPGGHVDYNESAIVALQREMKEEMNAEITNPAFLGALECSWDRKGQIYHELNLVYSAELAGLSLVHPPESVDKVQEFVWQPIAKINQLKILPAQLIPLLEKGIRRQPAPASLFFSQMLTTR